MKNFLTAFILGLSLLSYCVARPNPATSADAQLLYNAVTSFYGTPSEIARLIKRHPFTKAQLTKAYFLQKRVEQDLLRSYKRLQEAICRASDNEIARDLSRENVRMKIAFEQAQRMVQILDKARNSAQ